MSSSQAKESTQHLFPQPSLSIIFYSSAAAEAVCAHNPKKTHHQIPPSVSSVAHRLEQHCCSPSVCWINIFSTYSLGHDIFILLCAAKMDILLVFNSSNDQPASLRRPHDTTQQRVNPLKYHKFFRAIFPFSCSLKIMRILLCVVHVSLR